jgi:hypothetical protein
MSDFMATFFGPLDKDSCVYFLFLTIVFFSLFVFAVITEIIYLFKKSKELNFRILSSGLMLLFNFFIAYFVNRLLYTMCTKSLV